MKISTKGRYGLRAMLELAMHHGDSPVLMSSIAENQNISRKYLHALLTSLRSAGLVRSVRGSRGGYTLSHDPHQIRLNEIVHALEGSFAPVDCIDEEHICDRADLCVIRDVWADLSNAIETYLSSITLADLMERQKAQNAAQTMYYI